MRYVLVFAVGLAATFAAAEGSHAIRTHAGASTEALSHAQLAAAADSSCYRAAEELPRLPDDAPYRTLLRPQLPVLDGVLSALSRLEPPRSDAASFQLMLRNLRRYLHTSRVLLRFYATSGPRFGEAAMGQDRASVRLRGLSAKLGFGWCRWLWTPHFQRPSH